MVDAYVFVKANTPEADRLLRSISEIEGVVEAHIVAGDADLIAKVAVDEPEDVKEIVAAEFQNLSGVENTETYIAMD